MHVPLPVVKKDELDRLDSLLRGEMVRRLEDPELRAAMTAAELGQCLAYLKAFRAMIDDGSSARNVPPVNRLAQGMPFTADN